MSLTKAFKAATVAASLAVLMATGASAATLSLIGATNTQAVVNNNSEGITGPIEYITAIDKDATNGLFLSGPARVTFTFLGFEASNRNYSTQMGGNIFTNGVTSRNTAYSMIQLASGLIDFAFGTSAPAGAVAIINNDGDAAPKVESYAIGYKKITDTSWYALFDDIAEGDRDFDDVVLRVDVAPVPVPAAGLLLLGGLGAFGAIARRRKSA